MSWRACCNGSRPWPTKRGSTTTCSARGLSFAERSALAKLLRPDQDGIAVRAGASGLNRAELGELGLAGREVRELLAKIESPTRPDFSLDLDDMRTAEEMEAKTLSAVPAPERRAQDSSGSG